LHSHPDRHGYIFIESFPSGTVVRPLRCCGGFRRQTHSERLEIEKVFTGAELRRARNQNSERA
jgi:hypothetical protein